MSTLEKQKRQVAAATEAAERTLKRVYSLSVALMRAKAAYSTYNAAATDLFAEGKTDDDILSTLPDQLAKLQNNAFTYSSAMIQLFAGALYTVVEGWRKWKFEDATVDALLNDEERVTRLRELRHAIFHASDFDHKDLFAWAEAQDSIEWAVRVAQALNTALLDWHTNTEQRMHSHLMRVQFPHA